MIAHLWDIAPDPAPATTHTARHRRVGKDGHGVVVNEYSGRHLQGPLEDLREIMRAASRQQLDLTRFPVPGSHVIETWW